MVIKFKMTVSKACNDIVTFTDKEDKTKKVSKDAWAILGITEDGDFVQVKYYERPPFWETIKKGAIMEVGVSSFDGGRNSNHMAECVGAF